MANGLFRPWKNIGVTAKFGFAFALLLGMILLEGVASLISLNAVRKAEAVILTSSDIRQRVFEMNGELEKARRLHRDFFLHYSSIGFTAAENLYFKPSMKVIDHVATSSEELKRRIESTPVSAALREREKDLTLYLSTARRFSESFRQLVALVTELAAPGKGLEVRLSRLEGRLRSLSKRQRSTLLPFLAMVANQRGYMVSRHRPDMQAALNSAFELRAAFERSGEKQAIRARADRLLDDYVRLAQRIPDVDSSIRSKLNDFTLQAKAVDPISANLKMLTTREVERARARIAWVSRLSSILLTAVAATGLLFSLLVAVLIHTSVTRRIVALTRSAEQMRDGGPVPNVKVGAEDEIGVLAASFNDMSARVHDLVANLEEKVRQRTRELTEARDRLETLVRELDAKNRTLEVLSVTDRLTGLANRRRLEEALQTEIIRARRYAAIFSVIMLDVDHFKNINDTFGHTVGDTVLVQISGLLTRNSRETDIVGRWGGEEFLIVCPETDIGSGTELAGRYRWEIENFTFSQAGKATCSFGVTAHAEGDDVSAIIRRADAALYRAKAHGRNRVEIQTE